MLLDYLEHDTVEDLYNYFYSTKEQFKHKANPNLDISSLDTENVRDLVEERLEEEIVALAYAYDLFYDEAMYDKDTLYLVYDESTVDEAAQQAAESLAEDAKNEIPDHLQFYFDEDRYIDDLLDQGYSNLLSSYGEEVTAVINDTTYYIYPI